MAIMKSFVQDVVTQHERSLGTSITCGGEPPDQALYA